MTEDNIETDPEAIKKLIEDAIKKFDEPAAEAQQAEPAAPAKDGKGDKKKDGGKKKPQPTPKQPKKVQAMTLKMAV